MTPQLRQPNAARGASRVGVALAFALACGVTTSMAPREAFANPVAEALFKEARALLKAGEVDKACRKFAESQRLDPTSGTLLNTAACHEQQGKSATAWSEFLAAARLAEARDEKGRSGEARRRASLLEPKLSYLTIVIQEGGPSVVIKRNDEMIDAATFGSRLPIDPGDYVVTAEAAGHITFRTSALVKPDGADVKIDIPPLTLEPKEVSETLPPLKLTPAPPPLPQEPPKTSSTRRTVGFVTGGAGLAALGVGAAFGVMALSSYAKADDACPTHVDCPQQVAVRHDRAVTQAWVANIGMGAGIASLAASSYLLFLAPSKAKTGSAEGAKAGVMLSPHLTGLVAYGRF
jgi:hypothetical protein